MILLKIINILTGVSSEIGQQLKKSIAGDSNIVLYNNSYKNYEESYLIKCNLDDLNNCFSVENRIKKICVDIMPHRINVIHMAGILFEQSINKEFSCSEWEKMFRVNCVSFYWLSKLVHNIMTQNPNIESGSFVAVSSNLTKRVAHNNAGYAASKAALESVVKQIAYDCGDQNIRSNAIAPGYFKSNMSKGTSSIIEQVIIRNTPLHRLGDASNMADVISYIISPESAWVNGQIIIVDGGNTVGF